MDIRKVTRSPGWWRLFVVLTGLWYGGWLIGAVVTFSEEILNREPVDSQYTVEEIRLAFETAIRLGEYENVYVLEQTLKRAEDLGVGTMDVRMPAAPWYMDRDLQMFAAVVVLFPWIVFFNLCLMRYVIEGFIPERE